jgi:autotransporter passenger strand-loop-strand repeat protein
MTQIQTQIVVSETTSNVSTVDSSDTYLVESSGVLNILNGGVVSGLVTVDQTGQLNVSSGGTTLSAAISGGAEQFVYGLAVSTTVLDAGFQSVESGGTTISTTFGDGAEGFVGSGGGSAVASDTTINAEVTQYVGFSAGSGTAISTTISGMNAVQFVGEEGGTGTAVDTTIYNGGRQYVGGDGGTGAASVTTIDSGGMQILRRRTYRPSPRTKPSRSSSSVRRPPSLHGHYPASSPLIKLIILASFCEIYNLKLYHIFIQSR